MALTSITDASIPSILRETASFNPTCPFTPVSLGLRHIEELNLERTNVTDASVASLLSLKHLGTLSLASTTVTGAFLAAFGRTDCARSLRRLNLSRTAINDERLAPLGASFSLETLALEGTVVSPEAVHLLRQRVPSIRTVRLSPPREHEMDARPRPRDALLDEPIEDGMMEPMMMARHWGNQGVRLGGRRVGQQEQAEQPQQQQQPQRQMRGRLDDEGNGDNDDDDDDDGGMND